MVRNGFKRKNVPPEYLKAKKKAKNSNVIIPEPDDLDWAYIFTNEKLLEVTKTSDITSFCKIQHLKYLAHVTRLENNSLQKQLLFSTNHKKYSRDKWVKLEKDLGLEKMQIQKMMLNKKEFMSLLYNTFV